MLLAVKDIRFNRMRFALTVVGLTAILYITLAMNGLYRGVYRESVLVVDNIGADAWLVQRGTDAPFNDGSSVSRLLDRRAEGVPGVRQARRFLHFGFRMVFGNHTIRMTIVGLDFPKDKGNWIPLIAGRPMQTSHFEMIVDQSTGLSIGERLRIGRDDFVVVGVSSGQRDLNGEGLVFVSVADAQSILTNVPGEVVLLTRATKGQVKRDNAPVQAVMLTFVSEATEPLIRERTAKWGDITMIKAEQKHAIVMGRLWPLRVSILAFVVLMYLICGATIALTIFTIVLEKLQVISLLKLVGASNFYVSLWVLQYAVMMAGTAFILAVGVAYLSFGLFPRSVVLHPSDVALSGGALMVICVLASAFSVNRALRVHAREILS
jgi:putative ABC transport system permease protein